MRLFYVSAFYGGLSVLELAAYSVGDFDNRNACRIVSIVANDFIFVNLPFV